MARATGEKSDVPPRMRSKLSTQLETLTEVCTDGSRKEVGQELRAKQKLRAHSLHVTEDLDRRSCTCLGRRTKRALHFTRSHHSVPAALCKDVSPYRELISRNISIS